ncbi:MAG: hypothetical protein QOE97_864 [Pseudonocardiales bacterium]|jgi:hypothetical protein|nr:hypothetical protein [Pseudonocardiales bacterium]
MGWIWRMEAADGGVLAEVPSPTHPNQSDAESWLGENWRDLADNGVARVTLLDDDRVVYGPMSLAAE